MLYFVSVESFCLLITALVYRTDLLDLSAVVRVERFSGSKDDIWI